MSVAASPEGSVQVTDHMEQSKSSCHPLSSLVSIVVLNYKRRDALARTLDSILAQDYEALEIIVVDNHSEEDIPALVESRCPRANIIEMPSNVGTCAGRNAGIRAARGEYIVTLDNDVPLFTTGEISNVVAGFERLKNVDVLVFQVCDANDGSFRLREWCHPKYWRDYYASEFETYFLPEGACAFRRRVFDVVGGYYEPLFIGNEGGDLAFRILNRGMRIWYLPTVRVGHLEHPATRSQARTYRLYGRNYIWIAYKNYPVSSALGYVVPKLAMLFFFALRSGEMVSYIRGCWEGIAGLNEIRRNRTVMQRSTIDRIVELDQGRPSIWTRLQRHAKRPLI